MRLWHRHRGPQYWTGITVIARRKTVANHFPAVPAGLALQSVAYVIAFPQGMSIGTGSPFSYSGVKSEMQDFFGAGMWGMRFTLDTPGTAGQFDQDATEAAMQAWLKTTAETLATITGIAAATIAASVTVTRQWQWTDGGTGSAQWSETWAWTTGLTF